MIIAAMALSAVAMRAQVLTAEQAVQQNPQVGVDQNVQDQEVIVADQEPRPFDKYVDVAYMSQTKEGRFGRPLNEVSFDYGLLSFPHTVYIFGGMFGTIFTFGAAAPSKIATTGAFSFEYLRYVHKHVALGAGMSVECCMLNFQHKEGTDENGKPIYNTEKVAKNTSVFISLMPMAKFQWFTNPHFGMYTKLGFGAFYNRSVSNSSDPQHAFNLAFQINPVAMEFGGYNFKGFVEAGYGMQGMLSAGFKYCF